ncbi:MAG: glycosyltransferase family 39 protein [Candidatus Omnitrophota bacterium]
MTEQTRVRGILFVLLFAGAFLRLFKWLNGGLWYDEAQWGILAQRSVPEIFVSSGIIAKPPLFGIFLHWWSRMGAGEFFLRLLPFFFGFLSLIFIFKLGKFLFDAQTGLISSAILSCSPLHVYYSQELTPYTLTVFLSILMVYYLLKASRSNRTMDWVFFLLISIASIFTNYFLFLMIFTCMGIFFIFGIPSRKWVLVHACMAVCFLLFYFVFNNQADAFGSARFLEHLTWMPRGDVFYIGQLMSVITSGYNAGPVAAAALLALYGLLWGRAVTGSKGREKRAVFILLFWAVFPAACLYTISGFFSVFLYRNLIFVLPACIILAGYGLRIFSYKVRVAIMAAVFVAAGFSLQAYYSNVFPYPEKFYRPGVHRKKDNRSASSFIIANMREGDAVRHTCYSTILPFIYYQYGLNKKGKEQPLSLSGKKYFAGDITDVIPLKKTYKRLWFVFSGWEIPGWKERKIRKYLDNNYRLLSRTDFSGIRVYLYSLI